MIVFDITLEDIQLVIEKHVLTKRPLSFKSIPVKEKRKYIMICMIVHAFEKEKIYSEKDVNAIIKPMIDDYVLIRRYLIDYKLLSRTPDGKSYWLTADLDMYRAFDIGKDHEK
jgi:hypothetical protein